VKRAAPLLAALVGVAIVVVMVLGGPRTVARRVRDALRDDTRAPAEVVQRAATSPFTYSVIDPSSAGDVKMVGDVDGDGQLDLVVGGSTDASEGLRWYRYPDWRRSDIATPNVEFTTDGELGDVDGDGDLDVVIGDGDGRENLVWFENPSRAPNATASPEWVRHVLPHVEGFVKDVELADFDGDGRLDIATREPSRVTLLFQDAGSWSQTVVPGVGTGEEGMASGDIDLDGDVDLVLQGVWASAPGGAAARDGAAWPVHDIGAMDPAFTAVVADLDGDGRPEVVSASSEHIADVVVWSAPAEGPASGPWVRRAVLPSVEQAHTLQAGDVDGDGDVDLVVAQMHTSADKLIMWVENLDGAFNGTRTSVIGSGGIHNGVLADIGHDGDLDLIGSNWTGNPPVELWENHAVDREVVGTWRKVQVTDRHELTFGLTFADVDRDRHLDIVSGGFWYANPGTDLGERPWRQRRLPAGMHAIASLDVDGDARTDVVAQRDDGNDLGVYWLEAPASPNGQWSTVEIGAVPTASHDIGAQGVYAGPFLAGERAGVLVSSGNGIYAFEVPATDPGSKRWPRARISNRPSDEGFAVVDVDGDGRRDVVATTGESKHVEWYQAPDWNVHHVADFTSAVYPDRVGAGDFNGDGRVDVIVTSENGSESGAPTTWWEQPADPNEPWIAHPLVTQGTTNSLDVADLDRDGDLDVVLAEHRGRKRLEVWRNDGAGRFTETVVSSGYENHLGAKVVDIDGDGVLDVVGIGYDDPEVIHLWQG
jgi:hypothetical protein